MSAKSVMKSFKYGFLFSILIMFMTFWVRKVFFEALGTELTGYYLLINQMLGYLNLAELGLGTASTYLLFKPLNNRDNEKLTSVFYVIKQIYKKIQLIILAIGLLLAFALPYIAKSHISLYDLYLPWVFFVLSTALSYSFSAESILLTADQKVHYLRIINGAGRVLCFILQIVILKFGSGFIFFSMLEVISVICQMYFFKKIVKEQYVLDGRVELLSLDAIKGSIYTEIKKTFIHKVSGVLIFNTDYIIVSIFLGLAYVTSYSSYIMLMQAISFLITTLSVPLNSALGHYLHEKGNESTYEKYVQLNSMFMCAASILAFCYYMTSSSLIHIWLGDSVVLPNETVALLAINCFCLIARTSVDIFKVAYGYMSDVHLPIFEGCINLVLSLILVQYIGVNGVILGTIISNISIVMIARPYYLYKNAFNKGINEFVSQHIPIWLLSSFSIAVTYYVCIDVLTIDHHFQNQSLLDFLIYCAVVGLLALIICCIIFVVGNKHLREIVLKKIIQRF